jgi:two-component system response regulator DesR
MQLIDTNTLASRPIFATANPLLIAGVREVLAAAGMSVELLIVAPESLGQAMATAAACLAILDGQALPHRETLAQLCRSTPGSRFVLWVVQPTADLLNIALECGIHGLLGSRLPRQEAASALLRICGGERVFRFDPDSGPVALAKPLQLTPRERHVLVALVGGASNAGIAAALHTTASTVKGCLSRLFRKTGTHNRRELAQLGHALMPPAERQKDAAGGSSFDTVWMLDHL